MTFKIVAPVDGSAASERILPQIAELARAVDAGVILVHVTAPDSRSMRIGSDYLEGLQDRAGALLPDTQTVLLSGEPACEVLKYIVEHPADLLALSTRGGSPLRRVLFGNTAINLIRSCPTALFIARPDWPVRPLRTLLIAVDDSRGSRRVIPLSGELAGKAGAAVTLVRVLPDNCDEAERALESDARVLRKEGLSVGTVVSPGDPVKGILAAARETNPDLIVLGTHGRRGSDRHFFGSVAESVLLRSEVPVLLQRTLRVPRTSKLLARGTRT